MALQKKKKSTTKPPPSPHPGVKFQDKFCLPQESDHERSHVTHKMFVKEIQ